MATAFLLSETDRKLIQEMLSKERRRVVNAEQRPHVQEPDIQTPDVYVANATTGIAALVDAAIDLPGFADCNVYRVLISGASHQLIAVTGLVRRVYNLSATAVATGAWLLATRDKFGRWYAVSPGGAGGGAGIDKGVKAYNSGTQSIAVGTTALIANTELWDTHDFHDNVTNNTRIVFTTAGTGKYLVSYEIDGTATAPSSITGDFITNVQSFVRDNAAVEVRGTRDGNNLFGLNQVKADVFANSFWLQGTCEVQITATTQWIETVIVRAGSQFTGMTVNNYTITARKIDKAG